MHAGMAAAPVVGGGVDVLGRQALHFCQQIGIETELENCVRLRLARELRVDRLIGPTAEAARHPNATQDVRPLEPRIDARAACGAREALLGCRVHEPRDIAAVGGIEVDGHVVDHGSVVSVSTASKIGMAVI
jgi:hypothetical protein